MTIKSNFLKNEWTLVPFFDKKNSKTKFIPEKGLGVTIYGFADRHSGTIINVYKNKKGKIIGFDIKEDLCKMKDVQNPREFKTNKAEWICKFNQKGIPLTFNFDSSKGKITTKSGNSIKMILGVRDYFYEYTL